MPDPEPKKRSLPIVGEPRRRLPVLQNEGDDDDEQDRPPWHWSGIGAVAIFLAWLPLASLVGALLARALRSADPADGAPLAASAPPGVRALMIGSQALAFAIAALAGGYLVGRFGGRAGRREATASGLIAAASAWAIAFSQAHIAGLVVWLPLLVIMAAIGGSASYAGGRLGLRGRRRAL